MIMAIDSIFLLIVIGGLILGAIAFVFSFHFNKKKSTTGSEMAENIV
jgi:flagellar basal body-associated protein FliL